MRLKHVILIFFSLVITGTAWCQCAGIMEPGFQFLTSSRGCAPFTVQIETLYLAATPGTRYFVNWGDGTPEQLYTQVGATGVTISHTYPNSPVDCGYDIIIDAENTCNPRGSVVPIETQVVVWTNDVISIDPGVFRVCQGYATDVLFTDNSDWNCYPRATRENNEARWIQWIYGTEVAAIRIPGVRVNSILPGSFPYFDPAPGRNPIYPVFAPGEVSIPINVPVTAPADVGREFEIALKNWNQCNPYDNNVLGDGNPFNPVNGDLVNGDNTPQLITARIVIVDAPQPDYITRLNNSTGPVQTVFCVGDDIYFDNETPAIAGASLAYRWEFFDNSTGTGAPIATRTNTNPTFTYNSTGQKLIRLNVRDNNAAGNCEAIYDAVITISPSLIAQINVTDFAGNPITPDFCQEANSPFTTFEVRFNDASIGAIAPTTQWRWEFYDPTNALVLESPTGGGFSNTQPGPFDRTFTTPGVYRALLRIRDNLTSCETNDEVLVRVFPKPQPDFSFQPQCEGQQTIFTDRSTLNPISSEQIVLREWDLDYDGTTFSKDPAFDNQTSFGYIFPSAGTYNVALRVTTDQGCSAEVFKVVTVTPTPNADFTPDRTSGCSTLQINFTNNAISGQPDIISEYRWEVDSGTGFQVDSIQHPNDPGFSSLFTRNFINNGTSNIDYRIRLRVITVNDCERLSAPVTITVFPGPVSGFSALNYSPFNDNCSPVPVSFSVDAQTQSLNPSDYTWTVADGNGIVDQISTGTTPAFSYTFNNNTQALQDFFVTLRASLPSGCFGDSTRVIRISPVPSSDFVIDMVLYDCQRMIINLNAVQKGLQEYEWTITSNGTVLLSSTTVRDNFDYEILRSTSADQNIEVTLITKNLANCSSPATVKSILVKRTDSINASFTATPLDQTLPDATITINNTTNTGSWQYLWDFGDGTTSTSAAPGSHTYQTFGTYTITLTVTSFDCFERSTATVRINPIPPVLDFSYDPRSGCVPLTVNFTNLSLYADPTTYLWEFGANEGTSRATNPAYTYYEPGVYSVTLSASNAVGEGSQITKHFIIEVYEKPRAQFSVKPTQIYFPGGKIYTDNQSFGATSYIWDFGDGYTSDDFEPEHVYNAEGVFDIMLTAFNTEGCSDTTKLEAGVRTIRSGQLLIPNAFSPNLSGPGNSQGQNDIFRPVMRGVTEFQMMVFNRWGELLFETTDLEQGWDGYYKARLCQQDVYVYKIVAKYSNGDTITRTGDIHLIR